MLAYQKLNIIGQFSILGVPRLLQSFCLSILYNYTYFLAKKGTTFINFGKLLSVTQGPKLNVMSQEIDLSLIIFSVF